MNILLDTCSTSLRRSDTRERHAGAIAAGIQPQAAMDKKGVLRMLYVTGDAMHSDLYYEIA